MTIMAIYCNLGRIWTEQIKDLIMKVKIRQENKDDFSAVFELNKLAFGQDNEAKLVELLRESHAFIPELSLVALSGNRITGHILFTNVNIVNEHHEETE